MHKPRTQNYYENYRHLKPKILNGNTLTTCQQRYHRKEEKLDNNYHRQMISENANRGITCNLRIGETN